MRFIKALTVLTILLGSATASAGILPVGIQTNVDKDLVTDTWGWTECASFGGNEVVSDSTLLSGCQSNFLAMAAYENGSSTYAIFAGANYADVTLDTDGGSHDSNGVQWYKNADSFPGSWGFTEVGVDTERRNCDTELAPWDTSSPGENMGMCWHNFNNSVTGGWAMNNGSQFEYLGSNWTRVLLSLDTIQTVPAPSGLLIFALGLFLMRRAR